MPDIALITRADDAGACNCVNIAIAEAACHPFIRNISLLAIGSAIEEAAQLFRENEEICFGLHAALNAEWSSMPWKPVLPQQQVTSLVDERGIFRPNPADFLQHPVVLEESVNEIEAQILKLKALGFKLSYMDFHMAIGRWIPGLAERMQNLCRKYDLIYTTAFGVSTSPWPLIPSMDELSTKEGLFNEVLAKLTSGTYFYLVHPAADSLEMRACGVQVAIHRDADRGFVTSEETTNLCKKHGVKILRYDEVVTNRVPNSI